MVAGYVIGVILIASGLAVLYKIFSGSSIDLQIIYYPFVGEKSAESSTNVSASFSCEEWYILDEKLFETLKPITDDAKLF